MTTFESTVTIDKSIGEVYQFLATFSNHKGLMPEQIEEWQADENTASFSIKNMAKLTLEITQRVPHSLVVAVPSGKTPFGLEFSWKLSPKSDKQTLATLCLNADLNMMLKMILKDPLQKLVEHQTQSLAQIV